MVKTIQDSIGALKFFSAATLLAYFFLPLTVPAATWLTDVPSAQAIAKEQGKIVLLDFTGSDWCGWCIRLKNEVFSQPEFEAFADQHVVLVEVDFPRQKVQSAELKAANAALARKFQIQGYPTVIVLDSDGKHLGNLGYQPGGPEAFISALNRISGHKAVALPSPRAEETKNAGPPAPLFNGAPAVPPPRFNDLVLKSISGPSNKRLAMINNQTFGVGESALLKLGDAQRKVKCVEIREKSVLVTVDGNEPRELRLRGS